MNTNLCGAVQVKFLKKTLVLDKIYFKEEQ